MTGDLLVVKDVKKYFGGVRAVDGVSFSVGEGERLFLIGPNGAGKTTLINLLSGHLSPDGGSIVFGGRDVSRLKMSERVKLGIARNFQLVNVFWNLSVLENIAVAIASREGLNFMAFKTLSSYESLLDEAASVAKRLGLEDHLDKLPTELSQGDRKILDVAITLALRPRLVLLDEPTSGVATREKNEIIERVLSALGREGTTAIVVEHDMDLVFGYARRILVMHAGKLMADGDPDEIRKRGDVRSVLLGGMYA